MAGSVRARALGVLLLVFVTHAVLAWLARQPGILTREDDAEYIVLAQSLREFGYNDTFRIGEPAHTQYPPGYPVMLAVWGRFFGDGFDALTALTVMLSLASLMLIFLLVRRVLGEYVALVVVAVLAVNPHIVTFAGAVLSETPYVLLTALALVLLHRKRPGRWALMGAGATAIAAALTRSAGVTLVAAVIVYWLVERRFRAATVFAIVSLLVLGSWFLWTMTAPEQFVGASYVADISAAGQVRQVDTLPWRIPGNIAFYARTGVPSMLAVPTVPGTPVDNAVSLVLLTVFGGVGLAVFARRWQAGLLYALSYGGLLAVWVWRVERFVVPVVFLIVAAVLGGAWAIGSRLRAAWGVRAAIAVGSVLFLSGLVRSASLVMERAHCDQMADGLPPAACVQTDQASFFNAVRWIRTNTAAEAVFLAAKASPLWYHAGRQSVGFRAALAQPPDRFIEHLRDQGVDFILLGSLQFREPGDLLDQVAASCSQLTVAAFFPARTWIFSLAPPRSVEDAEASCAAVEAYRERNRDRDFEAYP